MLTIVVGLPGSGKSHLAAIEYLKNGDLSIYEDLLSSGVPWSRLILDELANAIRLGRPVMANDALLCLESRREEIRLAIAPHLRPDDHVRWLYFENAPERCRRNVEKRFRVEMNQSLDDATARKWADLTLIDALTSSYRIPDAAEVLPVIDYLG